MEDKELGGVMLPSSLYFWYLRVFLRTLVGVRLSPQEVRFALSVTYKYTLHLLVFQNTVVFLWGGSLFDDHFASGGSVFMRKVGPVYVSKNTCGVSEV